MHVYACICMYMHVYSCKCMYMHVYSCICMYMHACMYIHVYSCICMYMHARTHACMHVCMYVCVYVCMYVCMYTAIINIIYISYISRFNRFVTWCTLPRICEHGRPETTLQHHTACARSSSIWSSEDLGWDIHQGSAPDYIKAQLNWVQHKGLGWMLHMHLNAS